MTIAEIKAEESRLFEIFRNDSLPENKGIILEFLPSDKFIRELTTEFNVEFAAVFTLRVNCHFLFIGTLNSISIPIISGKNNEILIKHSHPQGSEMPSIHDINWLKLAQNYNSPQKKSTILPKNKKRTSFNINSKYAL